MDPPHGGPWPIRLLLFVRSFVFFLLHARYFVVVVFSFARGVRYFFCFSLVVSIDIFFTRPMYCFFPKDPVGWAT